MMTKDEIKCIIQKWVQMITLLQKKIQNSVTIWEHFPKGTILWTIFKQKKSVTIWGHGLYMIYITRSKCCLV